MGGHKGLCGVFCVVARARVGSGRQGEGQGAAVSLQGMSPSRLLQVFPGGSSACPGLGGFMAAGAAVVCSCRRMHGLLQH